MRLLDLVQRMDTVDGHGEAAGGDVVEMALQDLLGRSLLSPPYDVSRTPLGM